MIIDNNKKTILPKGLEKFYEVLGVFSNKYATQIIQIQSLCSENRTLAAGCLREDLFFATMEETWPREHKLHEDARVLHSKKRKMTHTHTHTQAKDLETETWKTG